jgi:glycine/sarcosine N-methyltransferase
MNDPDDPAQVAPAADYDRFVDWSARLKREAPLFHRVFEDGGVLSVLDAGCGTGMHAIMWAQWGLDVTGVDPDASMLAQARLNASAAAPAVEEAGGTVRFLEGGFGGLAALGLAPFDAITCTGNALPHVEGVAGLRVALADFAAVLSDHGLLVLHLLDHDRLLARQVRSIPPVVRDAEDGTWVFLRVIDYAGSDIRFDFVTLHRPGGWDGAAEWETTSRRSVHTALPSRLLVAELEAAGFGGIELLGNHAGKAFDPEADESLIVLARKA